MKNQPSPFETHAAEYDLWFDSERGSRIFSLELDCLRQAVDTANGHWLEVGVGSGRFANALGVRVGVDPSQEMLGIASERGIEAHLAPGERLPFEDSLFDGVLLVCTICFLDDPRKTLRECWRVLNAGGRLVIGFVPSDSPWGDYHSIRGKQGHTFYSSARFYTSDEIKALAESAGFTCQAEHGCVLPIPDESLGNDDISGQHLRDESFVVLSFFKKNNNKGDHG